MNNQTFIYLALVLGIANVIGLTLLWQNFRSFNKLRKTFFSGHNGKNLEDLLLSLSLDLTSTKNEQMVLQQHLTQLKKDFQFAIQKFGVVKFNPFADTGGNLSFSLALLDSADCGIIITNMHSREQNRMYLKKVSNGKSEIPLTEEELQAIKIANRKTESITDS